MENSTYGKFQLWKTHETAPPPPPSRIAPPSTAFLLYNKKIGALWAPHPHVLGLRTLVGTGQRQRHILQSSYTLFRQQGPLQVEYSVGGIFPVKFSQVEFSLVELNGHDFLILNAFRTFGSLHYKCEKHPSTEIFCKKMMKQTHVKCASFASRIAQLNQYCFINLIV